MNQLDYIILHAIILNVQENASLLRATVTYCITLSGNDLQRSQTPYLNVAFGVKDLAMRWREQLKSETCFLKKVICFKYERTVFQQKQIELQKTAQSFRN